MTDAKNNAENGLEATNTPKVINPSEALTTVIEAFVESKINHSKNGVKLYLALANAKYSKTDLIAEIGHFVQLRKDFPGYKDLSKNKAFFDFLNTDGALLKKVQARALFEGRKIAQTHETAFRELTARYEISDKKDVAKLRSAIQAEPLSALQKRIKEGSYDDLAKSVLGEKTAEAANLKSIEQEKVLASTFGEAIYALNDDEKENLQIAMTNGSLREENLRPLLEKLGPAGRRELLKSLRTTLSLEVLVDLGIISSDRARSMIRDDLLSRTFLPAETADPELLKEIENAITQAVVSVNLSDYRMPTQSLDATTIDIFSKTPQFAELIGDQLNTLTKEFNKSRRSPNVSTQTTAEQLVENVLPKSVGIHSDFIEYLAECVRQNKPAYIIQKVIGSGNQEHTVYLRVENWDDARRSVDVYRLWVDDNMLASNSKGNKDIVLYTEFAAELENSSHLTFLDKEAFDWRIEGVSKLSEEPEPFDPATTFGQPEQVFETRNATEPPANILPEELDLTIDPDVLDGDIEDPVTLTETPEPVTAAGGGAGGNVPPIGPSTTTPDESEQPEQSEQSEQSKNSDDENETLNTLSTNPSLEQLLAEINEIDPDGAEYGLKVGTTLMTNDPGTGTTDFGILHIKEIREPQGDTPGLIVLRDGLGGKINVSFNDFYLAFKGKVATKNAVAKRIAPIADASGFLSTIKSQHPNKWAFDEVEFDQETHRFTEKSRAEEKNYKGTRFFINDGYAVEIVSHNGPNVTINFYTDVKSDDKKTEFKGNLVFDQKEISYQALATLFLRYNLTPSGHHRDGESPIKPIETQSVDQSKTTPGHVKHWFWKLSINDVLHGGKHFIDFLKEKIAHGNHLQEARVMLMLGRGIGLDKKNSDWFLDLKAKVENNEKKLVEERLEELGKMGGPDRQKSVYDSLMNNGSHDYEHWASVFSMLEKHGTLYVGADLRKLEGSYIFFKRVAGLPLGVDVAHDKTFKYLKKKLIDAQEPVTEEGIIREYMKAAAGGKFNSLMWILARGKWAEGIRNEQESGKKEGDGFMTMDRRVDNAMGKFRENEYSKGIGAALAISDKPGSAARKHTPWVVLAISRKPERFHQDVLQKLAGYYDEWRTHSPALMFLKDPKSQEMFRQTILALCEVNDLRNGITRANRKDENNRTKESMVEDFEAVLDKINQKETFGKWNENESFMFIEAFWKKHGETLQPQLTQSARDPVTIYESANNAVFAAYNSKVNNELWNTNFSNVEMDLGTYLLNDTTGASVIYAKTDKVLGKIKVNPNGISLHQGDKPSELFFGHFIETVKDIKKITSTPAEAALAGKEAKEHAFEKQFTLYSKLHEEFYKFAIRETGQNFEKFWEGETGKSYSPPFAVMHDLGFNSQGVKWSVYDLWKLKTQEYKDQVRNDFAKFLSINHSDTSSELIKKVRAKAAINS